jgi:S-DNA-T family DNA segregation ATPase FtsK/SpoIIIE
MNAPPETTFHRPPREWPPPPPADALKIHPPPTRPDPPTGGLLQAAFPAIGGVTMLGFALVYGNPIFIYLALGMMGLMIMVAFAMRASQWRQWRGTRTKNRKKYRAYLTHVERQLAADADGQLEAADRLYPDHERLWGLVMARRHLWERRAEDSDFLTVRLGRGQVGHVRDPQLEISDDPLTDREQDLEEEAATVHKTWQSVNDAPVTADLRSSRVLSLVGNEAAARGLARSLVCQLAAFRAPDDLRVLVAHGEDAGDTWDWVKWLPHARASAPPVPGSAPEVLLATSRTRLAALLEAEVGPRLEELARIEEEPNGREVVSAPRLVLVIDGFRPELSVRLGLLREVLDRGDKLAVTAICLTPDEGTEPSEADVRVVLSAGASATVEERFEGGGRAEGVWPDDADPGLSEALARSLAPLRLRDREAGRATGEEVRAIDLFGCGPPQDVDPAEAWRRRPHSDELRVPIGVGDDGTPVVLDLKQAAEGGLGPHGLIVGATGSGKSELLRTLVSGLAVQHSPETLSFVLIDYKGGAAFAELARLPHAAGIVTNLQRDRSLVDRMRDALLGEQERRQRMLRDAGNVDDIRAYRAKREEDPSLEPMPYLLVVVDEFGELLASRPEFIDLFNGIGRVGRSLGMHLLFSSQRLDEGKLRGLESHLRYRLCLRTYSAVESKVVLGTPDAYLLPPHPGLAYLKVDTSIYERFKVALVSGPPPREAVPISPQEAVQVFSPGDEAPVEAAAAGGDDEDRGPTELDLLVDRLAAERDAGGFVHQVWVPPLPREVPLAGVLRRPAFWEERADDGRLRVPAGLLDLPSEQRTAPLELDFAGATGNLAIVGAPQTGKSTLLRSLLIALCRDHSPAAVRIYGVDLGGGGLSALERLPHVGGVASTLDRDRVRQTIRHVRGLVEEREELFRRLALTSSADARARRARGELEEAIPDVFLVVDGAGVLRRDFEGLDEELERIAAAGLGFGIHLVVTATRWGEMRPALRDQLGSRLELRLNDPLDSEIGRKRQEALPADVPGRGLAPGGEELQAALPDLELVEEIAARWDGEPAPPVPVLPLVVTREEVAGRVPPGARGVPLGLDELRLEAVMLDLERAEPHLVVLGDGESGKTNLLRSIARHVIETKRPEEARLAVVDYRRGLLDLADAPHVGGYAANARMASDLVAQIAAELATRLPGPDASREELLHGARWSGPHWYLLVDDYDLVPSQMDNPMGGLVDLLAHGRDVGLHVIVTRRVGGVSRSAYEPFFQRLTELRPPGLILSGDPDEGPLMGGRRAEPLPPGRGLLVLRGLRPALVQTPLAEPEARPGGGPSPDRPTQGVSA